MLSETNLVWVDLEMTGLDPDTDYIIEIATIVTDQDLNILEEGPSIAIRQPDAILQRMDEWNTTHHERSGLTGRVRASGVDEKGAEEETLEFLRKYVPPGQSPMCGNSICQDRRFMYRHMLELERFFHYRNLDVSAIKELARRWRPELVEGFTKKGSHLAMEDIKESIAELRYYREHFIRL